MKKILIASVMLAAMGLAQAQVAVYGKARVYQESTKVGTADAVTSLTNDSSRFGIKATEALADGMTASVVIETGYGADAPAASTLGDRTAVVGLSNKLGSVAMGRDKHVIARTLDNFDAMGNAFGSSTAVIHAAQGSRLQNAMFLTVKPVTGLSVNYQNANSEVAGTTNAQAVSAEYTLGSVAATLARYDNGTTSVSNIAGAKYKFANTTVFGMYSEDKVSGVSITGKSVGVNQAMGAVTLLAGYGENDTVRAYNVGATYNLSKTTMLHARYVKEDSTTNTQKFGAGMEMNF
jgi:predicted porin